MIKKVKQFTYSAAIATLIAGLSASGVSAVDIDVTGNGSDSTNTVIVSELSVSEALQENETSVHVSVHAHADSGDNSADDNTGGNVEIETGDATSEVVVEVVGGVNELTDDGCGCLDTDTDVDVSGNGSESSNTVSISLSSLRSRIQSSKTRLRTRIRSIAESGNNSADDNTGGDAHIDTGDASSFVSIYVSGALNIL